MGNKKVMSHLVNHKNYLKINLVNILINIMKKVKKIKII